MRLEVPAGHLAEVRGLAAQMGYSASDCAFATTAQPSPAVVSVEGTVWTGTDSDGDLYTWRFLPGGNVNYTSPSGTFSNCTWQQQGARVTWVCNNHYSDYGGTIAGNQLNGTARNVASHTWSFSLTRQGQPVEQTTSGVVGVEGTAWTGTDSDGDHYTWRFLSGGNVNYTSPSGTFSVATWRQQGARVTWETNNHYADYDGTITGNQLNGTARNVANRTWTFSLTRQRQP